MKTSIIVVALLASSLLSIQAQYRVVTNGANYRVWQMTTNENGVARTHSYTELATGLYFTNSSGQLAESKEIIEAFPNGAIARQGPYQVIFASNLNSAGAIDMQTPDGKRLRSNILGLAYYDSSSGKSVLIAQVQDSRGELISSNQVLYPNAFDGVVKADVRYTYRKGAFEQDVILREQPPAPEAFGLNSKSTEIEVLTEFIAPPQASVAAASAQTNALPDEEIGWGVARIGRGRAFDLGEPRNSQVKVRRQYVTAQGRNILVEGVPIKQIEPYLANLPLQAGSATKLPVLASKTLVLPPTPLARVEQGPMRLASASPSSKGFVLDYVEMNTDQGDFTFESGQTYFISGALSVDGTATIEGGAVIKFPEDELTGLNLGAVVCDTTAYSNAVFTSMNDDSVGDIIDGSSGGPAMGVNVYLSTCAGLSHCRFYYAGTAVNTIYAPENCCVFDDVQFYQCCWGVIQSSEVLVNNGLVSGCWIFGDGGIGCNNVTFDNCFAADDECSTYANCVFSRMGNIVYDYWGLDDGEAPYNSYNNGFDNSGQEFGDNPQTFDGSYQTGPLGNYYLPTNSPLIDAGNVTADRVGLYWWTTQTNQTIEGISPVDLGYHYPAVDAYGNPAETEDSSDYYGYDYLIDPDGTGLPYDWQMDTFGNTNQFASTLDPLGDTLLSDYTNGVDFTAPVQFTVRLGNQQFNTTTATGSYLVLGGVPGQEAVLVNDTNLDDAVWQPYDGNINLNLGPTDGVYQVWFGLKSWLNTNAPVQWMGTEVTLNRKIPQIFITSPATNVVATPYIQLQGYTTLPLAGVTFDESNAVSFVTNQPGQIIGHTLNTNTSSYTTDYFQCFDIPLTNGLNIITVRATDPAGNSTNIALNVTLDYTTATNPVIQLAWPTNGMEICATNFTLRGWTEDASATVSAQITDTNGDMNVVSGIVERTGVLWVNNLPLAEGTNFLTLTVTNSAGLSSTTNIYLVKSDMVLTLTNIVGDLWLPAVNVSGLLSDPTAAVWVNGVQGTNHGNGTWSASGVPVPSGGMATFDFNAIPAGGDDPNGDLPTAKPNEEVITSDTWSSSSFYLFDPAEDEPNEIDQVTGNYTYAGGGLVHEHAEAQGAGGAAIRDNYWVLAPGGNIVTSYSTGNGPTFDQYDGLPLEAGELSLQNPGAEVSWPESASEGGNTKVGYFVGGTGQLKQQVLLAATATSQEEMVQYYSYPGINYFVNGPVFTDSQVRDGDLGQQGDDGMVYKVESAGSMVDVTATASAPMQYPARTGVGPYVPEIKANWPTLNQYFVMWGADFCVGEQITFNVAWQGATPAFADAGAQWTLPGMFVTEPDSSQGPLYYYEKPADLYRIYSRDGTLATGCWYVQGLQKGIATLVIYLHFQNGQNATVNASGKFSVHQPTTAEGQPYQPDGTPTAEVLGNTLTLGVSGVANDMNFTHTITSDGFCAGQVGYVQVIDNGVITTEPPVLPINNALDNKLGEFPANRQATVPANGSTTDKFFDAPSVSVPGNGNVWENESFSTYLMFNPNTPGSIWVPLRKITWELHDQDMSGTVSSSTDDGTTTTNPSGNDNESTVFPHWTTHYP